MFFFRENGNSRIEGGTFLSVKKKRSENLFLKQFHSSGMTVKNEKIRRKLILQLLDFSAQPD